MSVNDSAMPATADLLGLAIADPGRAEVLASEVLASQAGLAERSVAHQALGIVLRDRGHTEQALDELRRARRLARLVGDRNREADVLATLGVAVAVAGRTAAGLEHLDLAVSMATDPTVLAKILFRRGRVRYFYQARNVDALVDLERALGALRGVDEPVWLARTLNIIGLAHQALGHIDLAAQAVLEAESIFVEQGEILDSLTTLHNRGVIAFCRGDLPEALRLYDEASHLWSAAGLDTAAVDYDLCEALLSAGLASEAEALVSSRLEHGGVDEARRADLELRLADARLAIGDAEGSLESATRAHTLFRRQRRDFWVVRGALAVLMARERTGRTNRRHVADARRVAERLEAGASDHTALAWLVAGRIALQVGHPEASALLDHAASYRTRSSGLVRATAWQARALQREAAQDRRGLLAACRRGLDALDAHRASLGSSELRALATRHGDDLTTLALRHAARSGPRSLLEWSERRRATTLFQPPVHPPDDEELAGELAALRDVRRRLTDALAEGSSTVSRLDGDRARLEAAISQRVRHHAGKSTHVVEKFTTDRLMAALDGTTFVELIDVDAVLHALVAARGRVRHVVVGATADAEQAVTFARFALRQTARGRPSDLADVGRRLGEVLLGDVVRSLGDGPVVVSPTSRLHAAPWALLPSLTDRAVSVTPSAGLWLRARSAGSGAGARVLVAGPGLESGGAEIDVLAGLHPEAVLLTHGAATVARTLEALDGAAVAHVAAHGRFREDSPMFSSLDLDDGPLTVHDLERLDKAPYRMVLSACESGVMAPIGAGELLGLVAAMLSLGSAGVVSSVARVNDQATAELMIDVHEAIDQGVDLGEVLLRARQAARGDRVHEATAAAFLAMGA